MVAETEHGGCDRDGKKVMMSRIFTESFTTTYILGAIPAGLDHSKEITENLIPLE